MKDKEKTRLAELLVYLHHLTNAIVTLDTAEIQLNDEFKDSGNIDISKLENLAEDLRKQIYEIVETDKAEVPYDDDVDDIISFITMDFWEDPEAITRLYLEEVTPEELLEHRITPNGLECRSSSKSAWRTPTNWDLGVLSERDQK